MDPVHATQQAQKDCQNNPYIQGFIPSTSCGIGITSAYNASQSQSPPSDYLSYCINASQGISPNWDMGAFQFGCEAYGKALKPNQVK